MLDSLDLSDPRYFINRELSMLQFNRRVLARALDPSVPALERLHYLTISSTNLDEFFEIRVSRLQRQVEYGLAAMSPDGQSAPEILNQIAEQTRELVAAQYHALRHEVLPMLAHAGVRLIEPKMWSEAQLAWTKQYFCNEVLPVLTPIGLDPAHPFPHVQNKNLILVVQLDGTDAYGRASGIAVVQVPRTLPRVLAMPPELAGAKDFALLSTVIQTHIGELFPGMKVRDCAAFRVTRDSDLWLAEEETDDLLQALRGELQRRKYGDAVRLEVAANCSADLARFLLGQFELQEIDLYRVDGPVNLHRLAALIDLADRPDLRFAPHVPRTPCDLVGQVDLFEVMRSRDILMHQPYDSAQPILELLRRAAADPDVLAIKQTLYRTGVKSPYVAALSEAARAGKDVTAVVELRARFDEAANIDLATLLQSSGANVVYGVVGFKTHAKMLMVVRRDKDGIRRYVHLGTGNYHPHTARLYTDISLLTCDPALGDDVHQIFLQLTGLGQVRDLKKLLQAPFTMHDTVLALISAETAKAKEDLPARIVAKMNALSEPAVIAALYRASQAGVQVDLIVRGICCLRPGLPGISENIRVRSIVGRFLEHARIWRFGHGDDARVYAASADWMERNFSRRVEVAFPIQDSELRARVVDECLMRPLTDNCQAWILQADGSYVCPQVLVGPRVAVQEDLSR